jgi:ferric-dicitrate binding protein FerR (iron transport regulator)
VNGTRWTGNETDPVVAELGRAFDDARDRLPDDVTLRRMWARAAQVEVEVVDGENASDDLDLPVRRARAPRWLGFVTGMASTAALAVACAVWLWPRHPSAPVVVAAHTTPAPVETLLGPTAEGMIRTGAGERLALTLAGGTEARLESSSAMRVDRAGRAAVESGEIAFKVPHQTTGHSYVVLAGPYRVVVLGTRFSLRLDDAKRVFVDVQEGVVEVWDHSHIARVARLAPGETWASPEAPAAESLSVTPKAHARTIALASPGTAPTNVDDTEAAAQAALAANEPTRALALYRVLAQHGGPASENAAYEIGKILRDRMGQPTSAVAAWRRYRADHPNGLLRVEADVSIIETLVHAGDPSGALAEATDFVRDHPDSERRAEIARVAGDLYRTRGDYKRAVTAYQIALASPQVRDAAEPATFHRAECLMRLGDPSGTEATRAYLRRWPSGRFRTEAERLLESGDGASTARL